MPRNGKRWSSLSFHLTHHFLSYLVCTQLLPLFVQVVCQIAEGMALNLSYIWEIAFVQVVKAFMAISNYSSLFKITKDRHLYKWLNLSIMLKQNWLHSCPRNRNSFFAQSIKWHFHHLRHNYIRYIYTRNYCSGL